MSTIEETLYNQVDPMIPSIDISQPGRHNGHIDGMASGRVRGCEWSPTDELALTKADLLIVSLNV